MAEKSKSKFTNAEISAIVKAEIQNCDANDSATLVKERIENLDYYFGRPFGNEVDGRSSVVSTDVRDTIEWIMPLLMRIFTAGEDTVEFEPEEQNDIAVAKQATEYVNYIWNRDNDGFKNFYSWFKDALISKNGTVKIWWDDKPKTKRERYSGLDDTTFAELVNDENVEVSEHTERKERITGQVADPQTGQLIDQSQDIAVHDVVLTRKMPGGRVCVEPMPPEEFLISKNARSIKDARLTAHRKLWTVSDLIEEGYDRKKIESLGGDEAALDTGSEGTTRNTVESDQVGSSSSLNEAMKQIWVTECYVKIDVDGDGIAEMRKVTVAGTGFEVLSNEAWDAPRPFANLTPIIMPHRYSGQALADIIKDIQLIKSTILRQYLDNLYLQNNQREQVIERNIIDPNEVLSSQPGAKIRVKDQAIFPIVVPPVGQFAIEGLNYIDQIRENRTGVSARTQGLGTDPLHDTASGERIMMSAALNKIELVARVFAETGVKDAFRIILKLICMYQDKARVVRLTNNWVPIDPSGWNADMDMKVSVGMGTGDRDQQLQHAMVIAGLQEKAFQIGMVTPQNFMATAEMVINAIGQKGAERFFTLPQPQAPGMEKPDPEMIKVQGMLQLEQAKLQGQQQLEITKQQMQAQDDQHRNELEAARRQAELQGQMQLEQVKLASQERLEQLRIASQERIAVEVARIRNEGTIEAARLSAKTDPDGGADDMAYQQANETRA